MRRNYIFITKNRKHLFYNEIYIYIGYQVFDRLTPSFQQPRQMTETKLDQINLIEGCPKLYLSFSNDNLGSYMASDILSDKVVQDISLDENEIEPAVLNQIQR